MCIRDSAFAVLCSYAQYERVRRLLESLGAAELDGAFAEHVEISCLLPASSADSAAGRISELTAGSAKVEERGSVYRPQRIEAE